MHLLVESRVPFRCKRGCPIIQSGAEVAVGFRTGRIGQEGSLQHVYTTSESIQPIICDACVHQCGCLVTVNANRPASRVHSNLPTNYRQ